MPPPGTFDHIPREENEGLRHPVEVHPARSLPAAQRRVRLGRVTEPGGIAGNSQLAPRGITAGQITAQVLARNADGLIQLVDDPSGETFTAYNLSDYDLPEGQAVRCFYQRTPVEAYYRYGPPEIYYFTWSGYAARPWFDGLRPYLRVTGDDHTFTGPDTYYVTATAPNPITGWLANWFETYLADSYRWTGNSPLDADAWVRGTVAPAGTDVTLTIQVGAWAGAHFVYRRRPPDVQEFAVYFDLQRGGDIFDDSYGYQTWRIDADAACVVSDLDLVIYPKYHP